MILLGLIDTEEGKGTPKMHESLNQFLADRFRELADLIEQQDGGIYRVSAYRRAADTLETLKRGVDEIHEKDGVEGLIALPGIGRGIAAAIEEVLRSGHLGKLERLRGALDPVRLFQSVPGIGPALAREIHESLHVDSLEALEVAAHDGRLAEVAGVGPRRAAAIRANLGAMLTNPRRYLHRSVETPPVELILQIDEAYRLGAKAKRFPLIAPKRFNPNHEAWLPIWHVTRAQWHFTVLFSNTARAHELNRTHDWVVVYFYDDHHQEGQHTIVTESRGPMAERRVVRGREAECRIHYTEAG